MTLNYQKIESPIGGLYLVARGPALRAVIFQKSWLEYKRKFPDLKEEESTITRKAAKQLAEYFARKRTDFDLAYELEGTEFQKNVWTALAEIPYGKTVSYKHQAEVIGRPTATRAVGGTNGLNPLAIILPCHRVIGQSGKLTGYGGGLDKKEFLLRLEGVLL